MNDDPEIDAPDVLPYIPREERVADFTFLQLLEDKDEYYGFWEKCSACKHSQPDGGKFCADCGRKRKNS